MGVDFEIGALPAEAGLDDLIDPGKGCFLGQESVAKLRNLGHPPRVVRHVTVEGDLRAGAIVRSNAADVGAVTSAVSRGARSVAIVRIGWDARDERLWLQDGRRLASARSTG